MEHQSRSKVYKGDGSPTSSGPAPCHSNPEQERQRASDAEAQPPGTVTASEADQQFEKAATALKSIDDELAKGGDQLLESAFASVEDLLGENVAADATGTEDLATLNTPASHEATEPAALRETGQTRPEPSHGSSRHVEGGESINVQKQDGTISDKAADTEDEQAATTQSSEATTPAVETAEAVPDESVQRREKERSRAGHFGESDPFRRGLAALSFPLKHVPGTWRPLVNWIAISLVLWVPVVWVIALALRK